MKFLKNFLSSEFGKGSLILFILINIFNILNYVFHFSMARLLGPADYGVLAVLMSIVYIYNVPTEAIQNIVSRYTSKFNLKKQNKKIKYLMVKFLKKGFKISLLLFAFSIGISFFLAEFLKINFWLILFTNLVVFLAFSGPVTKGVLQGRKKFKEMGINFIIESGLKLIFAVSLVVLGFKVFGAITGVLLGLISGLVFGFYFNKDIMNKKEEKTEFNGIYSFSFPYFIAMFVIFLVLSLDIILAKKFFPADIMGQYAGLSMMGKIIFFGTIAVSKVMFPFTSEKHEADENSSSIFKKSLLTISILCLIVVGIYFFIPKLIISVLFGNQYLTIAPYLGYAGLALSFLSLSNLILLYKLSINKIKKPVYLFIFLIIEITLLSFFHKNILEYILAFMFSNIIMFICSLFLLER